MRHALQIRGWKGAGAANWAVLQKWLPVALAGAVFAVVMAISAWSRVAAPAFSGVMPDVCSASDCVAVKDKEFQVSRRVLDEILPGFAPNDVYVVYDFSCPGCQNNPDMLADILDGIKGVGGSYLHVWRMARQPSEATLGAAIAAMPGPQNDVLRRDYLTHQHGVIRTILDDGDVLVWLVDQGVDLTLADRVIAQAGTGGESRLVAAYETEGLIEGTPTIIVEGRRILRPSGFKSIDELVQYARAILQEISAERRSALSVRVPS